MSMQSTPYWRELSFLLLMSIVLTLSIVIADPVGLLVP